MIHTAIRPKGLLHGWLSGLCFFLRWAGRFPYDFAAGGDAH